MYFAGATHIKPKPNYFFAGLWDPFFEGIQRPYFFSGTVSSHKFYLRRFRTFPLNAIFRRFELY